ILRRLPRFTLFPYTTLFRSCPKTWMILWAAMAITTSNIKRVWRWLRPARLFSIILALWTLVTLALLGSIFVFSRLDRAQPADVMVILGAGLQGPDDRPGPARSEEH